MGDEERECKQWILNRFIFPHLSWLKAHQFICLPWLRRWSLLDENHAKTLFTPKDPILVSDAESLNIALKNGLGIGLRSRLAIEQDIDAGELIEILPNLLTQNQAPIWFVRPNNRLESPKAACFFTFCQHVIQKGSGLN